MGEAGTVSASDPSSAPSGYMMPPQAMIDLIDAPLTPEVSVGRDRRCMLLMQPADLVPITELAQPELRLAGLRLNPRTNGPSRGSYFTRLTLQRIFEGRDTVITGLPAEPRIRSVHWSPDGQRVAFTHAAESGIELWVVEVETGRARRLTTAGLNAVCGAPFSWLSDSRTLICKTVPSGREPAPEAPLAPRGPIIQENIGRKTPARTYSDLLKNEHDEALFAYYLAAQLVRVTLDGETVPIGEPDLIRRAEPAPGGQYLLVETLHRPFSYLVPHFRFPYRVEVWDQNGRVVRQIADLPLAEEVPINFDAVPTGPRAFGWRADAPATLYWTEARDRGDPRAEAEVRDQVSMLSAPFEGDATPLMSLSLRYRGVTWGSDRLALVWESWWQTRRQRTWIVEPGVPETPPRLLFDRSWEDRYNDPGAPLLRRTAAGTRVLLTADAERTLFLSGDGASPEGDRPFLDQFDLATGETERLWRSEAPYYERLVELLDENERLLLTRRETQSEPPNYLLRDVRRGRVQPLTQFPHPMPQLAGAQKELMRYQRADGVDLTATLYLPPGYTPADGPLPLLVWAYPNEFKSADAAGQVRDSPHRFIRVSGMSPLVCLVHGYAVLDNPSMPIVGEAGIEPNDSYIEQLVASARAAVEEVVRRGVADPARIAVGGHSYGAFMTANLLAHSDLFCAGVARSGAYNRTLTPFGFQAEERTLWEAPEVYARMSPFMHAHQVKRPLLLIHGEADDNSGTFPIQTERFYSALKGHGATARLVLLPLESHGYRARESVLHLLWETMEWLDRYVKQSSG
jgi:dipeptidyl aminopeptidase/acylaminoacyl peptidase